MRPSLHVLSRRLIIILLIGMISCSVTSCNHGGPARTSIEHKPALSKHGTVIWPKVETPKGPWGPGHPDTRKLIDMPFGGMVMRRFRAPQDGQLLKANVLAQFLYSEWRDNTMEVSICMDLRGKPDISSLLCTDRLVTKALPQPGLISQYEPASYKAAKPKEFTLHCTLRRNRYYWLVVRPNRPDRDNPLGTLLVGDESKKASGETVYADLSSDRGRKTLRFWDTYPKYNDWVEPRSEKAFGMSRVPPPLKDLGLAASLKMW